MPANANTHAKTFLASECFRTHSAPEISALYKISTSDGCNYDGFKCPMSKTCEGCVGPIGDQPLLAGSQDEEAHFVLSIPVLRCSVCEASYHHTAECTNFWEWVSLTRDGTIYSVCPGCVGCAADAIEGELDEADTFVMADYVSTLSPSDPSDNLKLFYTKAMLHQHLYLREHGAMTEPPSPRSPTSTSAKRSHEEMGSLSSDAELEPSSPKRQKREESSSSDDDVVEELVEGDENEWNYPVQPFPSPIY